MKIKYLGTGASEAIPALGCTCNVCKQSRILKGKDLRARSSMLVNDNLLIDFGCDTNSNFIRFDLDFNKVSDVLITHAHNDHLYPEEFDNLRPNFISGFNGLNVYGGKASFNLVKKVAKRHHMKGVVKVNKVKPFKEIQVGDYKVIPLLANHDKKSTPYIYLIEKDNKKMLYAHDTGKILDKNYDTLKNFGRLDFISFDCTMGYLNQRCYYGHMSLDVINEQLQIFKDLKLIDDKTIIVISHFTHNNGSNHSDLEEKAKGLGLICAYDGLEIEV